ncbi:unnamed protein product, partial [Didymodactylos carnosus]
TKQKCDEKKKKLLNMSSTFIYDGNDTLKENVEQQQQQQQKLKAVEPEPVTVSTKTTSESAITSGIRLQQLTALSPLQNNVLDQPSSRHHLPLLEPAASYPSQPQTRVLNRPVPLRNSSPISQVLPTSPHPSQHMSTPSLSSQISSSNFAPLAASSQHNFTSIQRPSNSQGVPVRKRPTPSNQTTSSTSQPTAKRTKVYEDEQVKENFLKNVEKLIQKKLEPIESQLNELTLEVTSIENVLQTTQSNLSSVTLSIKNIRKNLITVKQ